MSYEGHEEFICTDGHLTVIDSMELTYATGDERKALYKCQHCGKPFQYNCSVDETNGVSSDQPWTMSGKVKETGFTDVWQKDHHGNRYAVKLLTYAPDDPTRWRVIE